MLRIILRLQKIPASIVIGLLLLLSIIWAHIITKISEYVPGQNLNNIQQINPKYNQITIFITIVFIAPIIETFIFQHLLIKASIKVFKWPQISFQTAMLSIFSFGIMHCYSLFMVLATTVGCAFLYICYVTFEKKGSNAFLFTLLLHSLYNFYGWLIDLG